MYISTQHKFIYLAIPRTASRTTRNWVINDYGAVMSNTHHSMVFENEPEVLRKLVKNYFVFTTIRNPYRRMLSYWRHTYQDKTTNELLELFETDVLSATFKQREDKFPAPVVGFPRPQTLFIEQAKSIFPEIHNVDIEKIAMNFSRLPFVDKPVVLDHVGQAGNPIGDWREFYKKKPVREKIYQYFEKDFNELGFNKRVFINQR